MDSPKSCYLLCRQIVQGCWTDASITGAMACPKGLRHAFGIHCVMNEIPLPSIQKWLGHSSMETTAIYLQVMGKEERELASRMW